MPRRSAVDAQSIEEYVAEKDKARQERYAARAAIAAEKAEGTSLERAKIAALKEIASKRPGGSLPNFLERVGKKMNAKFERPPDAPEPPAAATDVVIAYTLSIYRPPLRNRGLASPLHEALHAADTLGMIVCLAGLRSFSTIALVCRAWREAVEDKARQWGVLSYVKAIGGGHGQRKAQLDTPTWLCALPVRGMHPMHVHTTCAQRDGRQGDVHGTLEHAPHACLQHVPNVMVGKVIPSHHSLASPSSHRPLQVIGPKGAGIREIRESTQARACAITLINCMRMKGAGIREIRESTQARARHARARALPVHVRTCASG